jgi:hypothetical protein
MGQCHLHGDERNSISIQVRSSPGLWPCFSPFVVANTIIIIISSSIHPMSLTRLFRTTVPNAVARPNRIGARPGFKRKRKRIRVLYSFHFKERCKGAR